MNFRVLSEKYADLMAEFVEYQTMSSSRISQLEQQIRELSTSLREEALKRLLEDDKDSLTKQVEILRAKLDEQCTIEGQLRTELFKTKSELSRLKGSHENGGHPSRVPTAPQLEDQKVIASQRQQLAEQDGELRSLRVQAQRNQDLFQTLQGNLESQTEENRRQAEELDSLTKEVRDCHAIIEQSGEELLTLKAEQSRTMKLQHELQIKNVELSFTVERLQLPTSIWSEEECTESLAYFQELETFHQRKPHKSKEPAAAPHPPAFKSKYIRKLQAVISQAHNGNEQEAKKFTRHLMKLQQVVDLLAVQERLSPRNPPYEEKDIFSDALLLVRDLFRNQIIFLEQFIKLISLVLGNGKTKPVTKDAISHAQ